MLMPQRPPGFDDSLRLTANSDSLQAGDDCIPRRWWMVKPGVVLFSKGVRFISEHVQWRCSGADKGVATKPSSTALKQSPSSRLDKHSARSRLALSGFHRWPGEGSSCSGIGFDIHISMARATSTCFTGGRAPTSLQSYSTCIGTRRRRLFQKGIDAWHYFCNLLGVFETMNN